MTQAGYVGDDVESVIHKLVSSCDNNIEVAQRGIVYLDEIDKIAFSRHYSRDISGAGVQQALLKMLEGSDMTLPARRTGRGEQPITINTSNILFIASGAFTDLEEVIANRQEQPSLGFGSTLRDPEALGDGKLLKKLEPSDLIKFGVRALRQAWNMCAGLFSSRTRDMLLMCFGYYAWCADDAGIRGAVPHRGGT